MQNFFKNTHILQLRKSKSEVINNFFFIFQFQTTN